MMYIMYSGVIVRVVYVRYDNYLVVYVCCDVDDFS